jgi:hypothetical protein
MKKPMTQRMYREMVLYSDKPGKAYKCFTCGKLANLDVHAQCETDCQRRLVATNLLRTVRDSSRHTVRALQSHLPFGIEQVFPQGHIAM